MRRLLLLALLAGCAQPPDALPRHIESALGEVAVIQVPQLHRDSVDLFGYVDYEQRVIRIRAGLHPKAAQQALGHEECHLALFDRHAQLDDLEAEERVCDAWGTARVNGW